jgi:hypothetical protein
MRNNFSRLKIIHDSHEFILEFGTIANRFHARYAGGLVTSKVFKTTGYTQGKPGRGMIKR